MNNKIYQREEAVISNTHIARYIYPETYENEFNFCKNLDYEKCKNDIVESSFNRGVLFEKEMTSIRSFLQDCLNDYCKNILKGGQLVITQSWVGKQKKGQSVKPHQHHSDINGCFYFNVPDDKTPLVFNRKNQIGFVDDFRVPVEGSHLILFPNKLKHWVPENKNKETRYVIGFNSRNPQMIEEWIKISNFYSDKGI